MKHIVHFATATILCFSAFASMGSGVESTPPAARTIVHRNPKARYANVHDDASGPLVIADFEAKNVIIGHRKATSADFPWGCPDEDQNCHPDTLPVVAKRGVLTISYNSRYDHQACVPDDSGNVCPINEREDSAFREVVLSQAQSTPELLAKLHVLYSVQERVAFANSLFKVALQTFPQTYYHDEGVDCWPSTDDSNDPHCFATKRVYTQGHFTNIVVIPR